MVVCDPVHEDVMLPVTVAVSVNVDVGVPVPVRVGVPVPVPVDTEEVDAAGVCEGDVNSWRGAPAPPQP